MISPGCCGYPPNRIFFPSSRSRSVRFSSPTALSGNPIPDAEILLLGDSFTNIYSMPEMNWGEAAGFAEQLSLAMQRPIDRIAQNDAGAHATRQTLAQELARGERRLDGVRVLVWQFAIRELAVGDWKPIALPEPRSTTPEPSSAVVGPGLPSGRSRPNPGDRRSASTRFGAVSRRDHVVHLGDVKAVEGAAPGPETGGLSLGHARQPLDRRRPVSARAGRDARPDPLGRGSATYGRFTRVELDDPDFLFIDLPTFWAEEVP